MRILTSVLVLAAAVAAQDRDTRVRNDRAEFAARDDWVYNDLDAGFAEARKTGKPVLAVIRCIP